ncbi:glutamate transport system permease protein [Sinosporangium album]|uniref:Glutamate transport system permease protein n=1 Tax=Sinosporangium album TaxID=504805 RepID=A0A1G7S0R6_9ACTN|nr:amino acid ABC transporter permease [Sinosporangium album]SDG16608.1 glutamate transport system permease protein [Sinosporangium album]
MKPQASILFDTPGPRTRLRNNVLTAVGAVLILGIAYFVWARFNEAGQFDPELWKPFLDPQVWQGMILPGLVGTLSAAALSIVLALVFAVVFGLGRLSDHWWLRWPSGMVVEFFRAIPVLLMIFFAQAGAFELFGYTMDAFYAVVIGLTLYNGSVLAEVFKAGVLAVPKGQSEAAYALGLRKSGVLRLILLPQATTAMMPALVSQMVIALKDSALGYIIAYEDLLNTGFRQLPASFHNLVPAAIVISLIYILLNLGLGYVATVLERRSRRSRKSSARPVTLATVGGGSGRGE